MPQPLRVYFDQNCLNARGTDLQLCQIDDLATSGRIVLIANPRNRIELGDGSYASLARARLQSLPEGMEYFRLDASPFDTPGVVLGVPNTADVGWIFRMVFPGMKPPATRRATDRGQKPLHDAMHIANAEDGGGDVFITRDGALLRARPKLKDRLKIRIETPEEFLARFDDHDEEPCDCGGERPSS